MNTDFRNARQMNASTKSVKLYLKFTHSSSIIKQIPNLVVKQSRKTKIHYHTLDKYLYLQP